MKKIIFFIFIISIFSSFNLRAEIAYIDINFILSTSEVGKHLNSRMEQLEGEYTQKYKLIENEILKKEKKLLSQKNILKKEEFDNKFNLLSKEVQQYRKDKQSDIDKLNKIKINKTNEILKELNPIITNFVDLNSISIVLPKKNIVVGKKNLDITDKILKLLNKKINKLEF